MNPTSRPAALVLLSALLLGPAIAVAEPSISDRETARALVVDGRAKLAAKDYEGAHKAFKAAHDIMGVPTTGLDLAKAQAALGLLIEARTTALDVIRMPKKSSEPEAFTLARNTAATLADQFAARIPSVVISVKGVSDKSALSVTVDGEALNLSLLTLPRKINPGAHTIVASAPGYVTTRRPITLKEGETAPVEITLAPPVAVKPTRFAPPPPAPPVPQPSSPRPLRPEPARAAAGDAQRNIGFVAGSLGAAGMVVSVIYTLNAVSDNNASKDNGHCDVSNHCDDIGKELRLRSFRNATVATVGFVVGAIGLAGGTVLVLTAPSSKAPAKVAIGPGSISVTGKW